MESAKVGLSEGTRVPPVGEWRYLLVGENSLTISGQTRSVSNKLNSFSYECVCVCVCV